MVIDKLMDKLLAFGKKAGQGILLAGLLSCAPGKPTFRARPDYAYYPGYEKEIALYNIRGILENSCTGDAGGHVDENYFSCYSFGDCAESQSGYHTNPVSRQIEITQSCKRYAGAVFSSAWKDIQSIDIEGRCLKFNGSAECNLYTQDERQAWELKQAMEIYKK